MIRFPYDPNSHLPTNALIKMPRQKRSIEMVHCILNAAMEVIHDDGLDLMSTNRVADRAGISIGSLYQYFADRESILSGIIERSLLALESLSENMTNQMKNLSTEEFIRVGLHIILHFYDPFIKVARSILHQAPLLEENSLLLAFENILSNVVRIHISNNSHRYRLAHGDTSLFVIVNSLVYISLRWILDPSPLINESELVEVLISQTMSEIEVIQNS